MEQFEVNLTINTYTQDHYLRRNKKITSINFVRLSAGVITIFILVHFEVNHMLNTLQNSKNNNNEDKY